MEKPPILFCTVELLCRLCRSLCRSSRSLSASCLWANLLRWTLCAITGLWTSLFRRALGAGRTLRSRSLLRSTTTTNHNYSGQNYSCQRKNLFHSSKNFKVYNLEKLPLFRFAYNKIKKPTPKKQILLQKNAVNSVFYRDNSLIGIFSRIMKAFGKA